MPEQPTTTVDIPGLAWRRALHALLVLVTSVIGLLAMAQVVSGLALGWQIVLLTLFGLTFSWIALAFWGAVWGFLLCALRLDPLTLRRQRPTAPNAYRLVSKTALVMPIYAEPPIVTIAGLEATCRSLLHQASAQDEGGVDKLYQHFDVFILSDTQNQTQAHEEATHVAALQQRLAGQINVHYRRRENNEGRKAGNIAEFCRRWGRLYDFMVVLDADSLMSGATLLHMVHRMQREPNVGLIQTVPIPVGQRTLFGRFQQLASALYSPMLAAGQSFWQGVAANYWGHNAIIRTRAFMAHAGLPTLPGKAPLGGELLSHDFVEAALLKRGGWQVLLDTSATTAVSFETPHTGASHNSFETMPSNFLDFAKRDRRWLQGNLQHLRLLTGVGFHPISRLHFLFGAFAYLSSMVWLALLVCAGALVGAEAIDSSPRLALPQPLSLGLFSVTLLILLAPKLLGFLLTLFQCPHAFGGRFKLTVSVVAEVLFAALTAPLMMAWHSLFIVNVLLGRSIEWQTQHRGERSLAWREVWWHTRWMTIIGALWAGAMFACSPYTFAWMAPVWLGLLMAAPIVKYSSSATWGGVLGKRWGLLKTPSITFKPALLSDFALLAERPPTQAGAAAVRPLPGELLGDMPCQSFQHFDRRTLADSVRKPP